MTIFDITERMIELGLKNGTTTPLGVAAHGRPVLCAVAEHHIKVCTSRAKALSTVIDYDTD